MEQYGTDVMEERYGLAMERIGQIEKEQAVPAPYGEYFRETAGFLLLMGQVRELLRSGGGDELTLEQWQEWNRRIYEDILPENYGESYGNPVLAERKLGEPFGKLLCFLYAELRGLAGYVFEEASCPDMLEEIVVYLELFIEVYNCFEQTPLPEPREIRQLLYWFVSDYCDVFVTERIRRSVDPARDFAVRIILDSDLEDLRYLYRYGEYVTENELRTARFLNSLPQEEIQAMADTYTEGYRRGFEQAGKDLSKKMTVDIRYNLGFERMVRAAIENFRKMGLRPVIYRYALSTVNRRGTNRIGFTGAVPNRQFEYDHREDAALYLDKKFVERRLGVMRSAYETFKTLAGGYAGPAVIEVFGETPFLPESREESLRLSPRQQQLMVKMNHQATQLTNQYIIGKERSFTIIAFPVPQIGDRFEEIFRDTVKINTLDNRRWQAIQQALIDTLDQGDRVRILGKDGNRTDLTVALRRLDDPKRETLFENCVADVNIPVGEVFTSPRLKGTEGVLHVSRVFLNELEYLDLEIKFEDGMIRDYGCANFKDPQENRNYVRETVLFHHDSLPLGEFAIGTNTSAYVMARKYGIERMLPILIAEKTGPHFAVGDTCYSWDEDNPVYNPDGKEIVARDNEVSILRKEDPEKAYFGCHTDITIPYEELGLLEVLGENGFRKEIIRDGRFVLAGTEELNRALENG